MSSCVPGIGDGAVELDQERLERDPQLQRRLTMAPGVEVGAGAQQQRLAGVDPFAAAEHRRDPLLRAQLLGALLAARCAGGPDVGVTGARVAADRHLLARSVADPHSVGVRGGQRAEMRVGGGGALGEQRPVEHGEPLSDEIVDRLVGLDRASQPALGLLRAREGTVGTHGGDARQRQLRRHLARLRRLGAPAPAAGERGRGEGFDDQHALLLVVPAAGQIAAIGDGQRAGEVVLRESEELGQRTLFSPVGVSRRCRCRPIWRLCPCRPCRGWLRGTAWSALRDFRFRRAGGSGAPTGWASAAS